MTRQDLAPDLALATAPAHVSPAVWAGVTVQAAWTLLASGVRVTAAVLRDARDHVLLGLDPHATPAAAADQAVAATEAFVAAARRRRVTDPVASGHAMALSPRWRRAIDRALDPVGEVVLREHFGNGRTLAALASATPYDLVALEGARSGLREVVRRAAAADGVPVDRWSTPRLDAVLARLAVYPPETCPSPGELLAGTAAGHVARCALCDRARRLVRAGTLDPSDLVPPEPIPWPGHRARVLVLHFHPDARGHRGRVQDELSGLAFPVEEDLLLVDLADEADVGRVLRAAAEVGLPPRELLRGVVVDGPGRWSRRGLLGPIPVLARDRVKTQTWGWVEGIGELPAELPPPPSARNAWRAVGALAVVTALVAWGVARPAAAPPMTVAEFTPGRGGVWTEIDMPDDHLLTLVRDAGGRLDVVLASAHPADKASLATGDGRYRLHTMGPGVLVVSSEAPIPDLGTHVAAAGRSEEPLASLAVRLRVADPDVETIVYERR